jgi:hypothetical protein
MSSQLATEGRGNTRIPNAATKEQPPAPPDERFWQRYSPHHEFPLSAVSSIFLHAVFFALVGLILAGIFMGGVQKSVPFDLISVAGAGGGGQPAGITDGQGAVIPKGPEAVQDHEKPLIPAPNQVPDKLKPAEAQLPPVVPTDPNSPRSLIDANAVSNQNLSDVGQKANKRLQDIVAPKGKDGPGNGGGDGRGKGPGKGPGTGPGQGGIRNERQNRWVMVFNTHDGNDYARQLQGLGAILAVPENGDRYLVIRDLSKRPVQPKHEDVRELNRIYWKDDKANSVTSLSQALGIQPVPRYLVAFFPQKLEEKLREEEKKHYDGDEDTIQETHFDIVRKANGEYEPVCREVLRKR